MFYIVFIPFFFFSFFWLGTLKIPQHNKLCMRFYIFNVYIFSSKYKLYALLTFKCFVALLFSLWQYFFSHTAFHSLFIFNFSPFIFYFFFGKTPKYLSKYVYICFVYAFSVHQVFCFSFPRHVWSCRTCLLCNKALFSLRLWPQIHLFGISLNNFLFAGVVLIVESVSLALMETLISPEHSRKVLMQTWCSFPSPPLWLGHILQL